MAMIDPSTQLATMIRAQFGAQFRAQSRNRLAAAQQASRDEAAPPLETALPARDPESGVTGKDGAQIQQMVALRVRALSPDDPQRQRKAFRLFLESVLMQAFGRERLDDRGFGQLVDAVLQRMESDKQLEAAVREAGNLLLADAAPRNGSASI